MSASAHEREIFARVLVSLVHQRCLALSTPQVSRTGLQRLVPVHERPHVRRGLDALISAGALAMAGENMSVTSVGKAFLENMQPGENALDALRDADIGWIKLQLAILNDDRFDSSRPLNDVETLPGRLEDRGSRRPTFKAWWVIAGLLAAIIAVGLVLNPRYSVY